MLEHIFSPITIKGKTVKNRCAVPAMVMNYCNTDGTCTERFTAYHETKAKGGFGMIITEDFAVCPNGKGFARLPGLWNDEQIPGFQAFTKRIHDQGALIIAQIYHAGRQTSTAITGETPWAPSAIPCPFSPDMPHEMTLDEIHEVVGYYGGCARRAETAGFDGVEIHGAHGYLIAQFMSPYSNKRTDEYGGPLQNRMRFALEVIRDVKSKVSDKFIVGFRISADEHVTGGRTLADTVMIAPMLEAEGIDYFNVTSGVYRSFDAVIPSMYTGHAWIQDDAAAVKAVVNVPVLSVGRYNDIRLADSALAQGKADMILFGRQSLVDPETPKKAQEGRFEDIRQCIGCHHKCITSILVGDSAGCILNPRTGHEYELEDVHTDTPKKVMVIGAGPGGMEAAIAAAEKGHKVTVYEKSRWAGGQFRLGSVPPAKGEITTFIVWQVNRLKELGVTIHFETEVTQDLVKEVQPNVIIASTGSVPVIPKIPGADRDTVVTAQEVLSGKANTGGRVVVIGGGSVGAETANHLASNLKSVTLVEMMPDIANDESVVPRWGLLEDLSKNQVRVCRDTTVKEIKDGSVVLSGKIEEEIPVDTVVIAVGARANNALADQLAAAGYDVRKIGDCERPGNAEKAIREGFYLGREI